MTKNIYTISPALAVKFFLNSPCLAIVTPQTSLVIKILASWFGGKKGAREAFVSLESVLLRISPCSGHTAFLVPVFVWLAGRTPHTGTAFLCLTSYHVLVTLHRTNPHRILPKVLLKPTFMCIVLFLGMQIFGSEVTKYKRSSPSSGL